MIQLRYRNLIAEVSEAFFTDFSNLYFTSSRFACTYLTKSFFDKLHGGSMKKVSMKSLWLGLLSGDCERVPYRRDI